MAFIFSTSSLASVFLETPTPAVHFLTLSFILRLYFAKTNCRDPRKGSQIVPIQVGIALRSDSTPEVET